MAKRIATATVNATRNAVRTARNVAARIGNAVLSSIDDVVAMARTVTPANFNDMLARANANHGVLHAGRHIARFTGHRVMQTQNDTLTRNAEWQLDDCQLLFVWRVLFPMSSGAVFTASMRDGIGIVRGVRADYNRTGHGMPSGKPAVESVSYGAKRFDVAENGNVKPATVPATKPATKPAASRARKTA